MAEKGVWRTVRGRKIFIAEGQSLSDAMKNSGKFKNKKTAKSDKHKPGMQNVTLDDVKKESEKLAKDLPQDKWAKETREHFVENVYHSNQRSLRAISHTGSDGKEYIYKDSNKNYYKYKYDDLRIHSDLSSWRANEVKINDNAPREWQSNVIKMMKKKYEESY